MSDDLVVFDLKSMGNFPHGLHGFCTRISAWNFNGLVGAEISCKNGRDIRLDKAR